MVAAASSARAEVSSASRWVDATPEATLALALRRAASNGDDAFGGLLLAAALDESVAQGTVVESLRAIARSSSPLADDARWLAWRHEVTAPTPWPGHARLRFDAPADERGLVRAFAVLGPFQDAGGGLTRREGPELAPRGFGDASARFDWGVYEVAFRRVLPDVVGARGLPLSVYIQPRSETCTYLASRVALKAAQAVDVHVASTGAVRLSWDGVDAAVDEAVHPHLVLDRLAVRIEAPAGDHLLSLKVCTSTVADDGRVRVRFTDPRGNPLPVETSSDLNGWSPTSGQQSRVLRLTTSLERALAKADESPTTTMTAALVRTLGGAEDTRSPRAPGLLDTITNAASVTPDALALAGWISPSAANRSAWLNLAHVRAAAAGDEATASFALRRLAEGQLAAHSPAWALATTLTPPLAKADDVEAKLLRIAARRALGGSGAAHAARVDLAAIAVESGAQTPVNVTKEFLPFGTDQRAYLEAFQRLAKVEPEARSSAYVNALRPLGGAELERAAFDVLTQQTSSDDVVTIGATLLDAGRNQAALDVFDYATRVAPNQPAAFRGLAASIGAAEPNKDDAGRIAAALRRALDLAPGDPETKAELGYRLAARSPSSGAPKAAPSRHSDEMHLVDPQVFLSRAKSNPAKRGEVFDRQVHWVRVVTYHPDKRVSQLMHYAREIVVEPRNEEELFERQIPSEGDDTELLLARVHRRDGTIAAPELESAGGGAPVVRWPELHTGDVVEIAVRSWTSGPVGRRGDAPFYFIDYVGSTDTHPVLYNEVVVDCADAAPLAIDVLNGKPDRVLATRADARTVTRYVWDHPPTVREEPLAPKLSESLPVVVGSTYRSWHDFREWYRSAVKGFTAPDDQVRRLAAELTKGKTSRDEKIRALFEFVADGIRYVNYVSGEWWLPNRPQELLARRQGDCDDKAMLLITLLRAVGIEATEVLVQTRYTAQPSLLSSETAAIPVFDHGIAYLPGEHGAAGTWLDATSPESRLGPLPAMDARAVAMFVDEGAAKVLETPASAAADHGTTAHWKLVLEPSGAGELDAVEQSSGDAAFERRMNLRQADARAQWVEQNIAGEWFPTVEVRPEVGFSGDLAGGTTELRYRARSEGLARREGRDLALPVSGSQTLTSQLAPLVDRTLPVVLPPRVAPGHQDTTIVVTAPRGYEFGELPPAGDVNGGEFGRAHLAFARGARLDTITVTRSVAFEMSTIPVAKYAAWRAWLQRVDGLMHRMIRLTPTRVDSATPNSSAARATPPRRTRAAASR